MIGILEHIIAALILFGGYAVVNICFSIVAPDVD